MTKYLEKEDKPQVMYVIVVDMKHDIIFVYYRKGKHFTKQWSRP